MNTCIILFARVPGQEPAKTRLAATLGAVDAARIYEACLIDTLEAVSSLDNCQIILSYTPPHAGKQFSEWLAAKIPAFAVSPPDPQLTRPPYLPSSHPPPPSPPFPHSRTPRVPYVVLWPQFPGDLGERMAAAVDRAAQHGFSRIILLGSDTPGLPARCLASAIEAVGHSDLVFGPAADGGFYLAGFRHPVHSGVPAGEAAGSIFQSIPWSCDETLQRVLECAASGGLQTNLLDSWLDLDVAEDIPHVLRLLETYRSEGVELAPRLYSILSTIRVKGLM